MEPNLKDMDDYNRPLKRSKLQWIIIVFAIAISVYLLYVILMEYFA